MQMFSAKGFGLTVQDFHSMTVGGYDILGRLEDVPLTSDYEHSLKSSVADFSLLSGPAYESGAAGYYFGQKSDHMSTPAIRSVEERKAMVERGRDVIARLVDHIDIRRIVDDMSRLKDFEDDEALSLGSRRLQRQVRGLRIWKAPSGLLGSSCVQRPLTVPSWPSAWPRSPSGCMFC